MYVHYRLYIQLYFCFWKFLEALCLKALRHLNRIWLAVCFILSPQALNLLLVVPLLAVFDLFDFLVVFAGLEKGIYNQMWLLH